LISFFIESIGLDVCMFNEFDFAVLIFRKEIIFILNGVGYGKADKS
jgi:hypothetical protein